MLLPALLTADLHLTAGLDASYRWSFFDWLRKTCEGEQVKTLLILGDLTDHKDNHPAELVNRIVKELCSIQVEHIYILRGNHDWLKDGRCFFEFLSELPHIKFITQDTELSMDDGPSALLLPHTRTPGKDWANYGCIGEFHQYVFMHQTYKGARSSNGQALDGDGIPDIFGSAKVYSGDIHVPQIIGPVEYVGSPYHVHFGDTFTGRCVLLDRRNRAVELFPELMQRHVIDVDSVNMLYSVLDQRFEAGMKAKDQVKLRVHLTRAEAPEWQRLRREMVGVLSGVDLGVVSVEMVPDAQAKLRWSASSQKHDLESTIVRYAEEQHLSPAMLETALELMEKS